MTASRFRNSPMLTLERMARDPSTTRQDLGEILEAMASRSDIRSRSLLKAVEARLATTPSSSVPEWKPKPRAPKPVREPGNRDVDIVSGWIAQEVLSPQTHEKPEDMAEGDPKRIVRLSPTRTAPWLGAGERPGPGKKYFYHVVLGTIPMAPAFKALLSVYADRNMDRTDKPKSTPLAILTLNDKGIPVMARPLVLSSFAWGLPRALDGNLNKLGDWADVQDGLLASLEPRLRHHGRDGEELPLDFERLRKAFRTVVAELGVHPGFVEEPTFAIRELAGAKTNDPQRTPLLSSFLIDDLIVAKAMARAGTLPKPLARYLGRDKPNGRLDLLQDHGGLADALSPARIPEGRWPSRGRHPLALLQQAAVNLALSGASASDILPVNGPPGTGKTTLLRDVVAGLIVRRAAEMCRFDAPAAAFTPGPRLRLGQADLQMHRMHPNLKGFEMLVASANNAGVENVSRELPALKAIADDAPSLRYFKSVSDHVAGSEETWGLVAAVFGKSANRKAFAGRAWEDDDRGLRSYLNESLGMRVHVSEPDPENPGATRMRRARIVELERPPSGPSEALERWRRARETFKAAFDQVVDRLKTLEDTQNAIGSLDRLEDEALAMETECEAFAELLVEAQERAKSGEEALASAKSSMEDIERESALHARRTPSFLARIFNGERTRNWQREDDRLVGEEKSRLAKVRNAANAIVDYRRAIEDATKVEFDARKRFTRSQRAWEDARSLAETCGSKAFGHDFMARPRKTVHLDSPWLDTDLNGLRDRLFELAMEVHAAFAAAAAGPLRENLEAFFQHAFRKSPKQAVLDALPDLWSSLFLMVPVVSTTFSSVGSMTGNLPPGSIGWLLVDEAGQASPQAAAGALIRARKAIVVGDPLQIPPVTSLPTSLVEAICRDYGVDPDRWTAPETSVQTLADATSSFGTTFRRTVGSIDVGVPLLVHRRCADPMFSLSNEIAYSGLMVHATNGRESAIRETLGESHWIDVKPQSTEDKWSDAEGEAVLSILRRLSSAGVSPDLYVVTPFTVVKNRLIRLIAKSGVLNPWAEDPWDWARNRIGTVHTVQGREADSVVLVLGAPLPEHVGARGWAGGQVNLLNVAVTRAQENLYVVGSHSAWAEAGHFRRLADLVRKRP